jgi:hypothetical protein
MRSSIAPMVSALFRVDITTDSSVAFRLIWYASGYFLIVERDTGSSGHEPSTRLERTAQPHVLRAVGNWNGAPCATGPAIMIFSTIPERFLQIIAQARF